MGLAMSMTGRRHDAEDLVQETSSLVIAKWPKVSQADDVDAYVRRIMVNTLMSSRRPRWRSEIVSSETVTQDHRHRPAADPPRTSPSATRCTGCSAGSRHGSAP